MSRPRVTRMTLRSGPAKPPPATPKAGDLRTVGGRLCVRRQAMALGSTLVRRGKPAWEWVPVWADGKEFAGCTCKGGPPEDRCDRKWLRCNGRLGEQRRRVEAILAYRDPDVRRPRAPRPKAPPHITGAEFVAGIRATAPEAFLDLEGVLEPSDVHEDMVTLPNFGGGYKIEAPARTVEDVHIPNALIHDCRGYTPGRLLVPEGATVADVALTPGLTTRAELAADINARSKTVIAVLQPNGALTVRGRESQSTGIVFVRDEWLAERMKKPGVCRGCLSVPPCATRAQMLERHGTPEDFEIRALAFAAEHGYLAPDEARAAADRYRRDLAAAPEGGGS